VWWVLAELVLDLFVAGSLVASLEARDEFTRTRDRRALALFTFLIIGVLVGLLSWAVMPRRVVPAWPFKGASLIVVPLILGSVMACVRRARPSSRTHLATWYGGATLGLGLAAGRLLVVWQTAR
jgi:hypothetical protein